MNFKDYQKFTDNTKIFPKRMEILYPMLGLQGELGEVAEKIKKVYRDKDGVFSEETKNDLKKEIGDVLWYLCTLSTDSGFDFEDVAKTNMEKILSRKERGVINGNGDNR